MKSFPFGGIGAAIVGIGLFFGTYSATPPAFGQAGPGQVAPSVAGLWLDNEGKAAVEVKGCGPEICGNIVWLKQPLDPKGKPWTDMLNPDTGKRGRPVCGLQIIGGLKPDGKGQWQDGWIYDPEEGKNFNVELSLSDPNTLKVFGYAGIKLLSETMLWKRLPGDSARCKA